MSEGPNLVPGHKRRNNYTGRDRIPTAHVDLGRSFRQRRAASPSLHIVVREGEGWVTLCKGAGALRSFLGRPDQAGCSACKREALRLSGEAA